MPVLCLRASATAHTLKRPPTATPRQGKRPGRERTVDGCRARPPDAMTPGFWISPPSWQAPSWEQFDWAANCSLFGQYIAHTSLDAVDLYGANLPPSGRLVPGDRSAVEAYILSALPADSATVPSGSQVLDWHYYYRMIATYNVTESPDIPRIPAGFQFADNSTAPLPDGIPAYIAYTLGQTSPSCIQEGCETLRQDSFLDKDVAGIGVGAPFFFFFMKGQASGGEGLVR